MSDYSAISRICLQRFGQRHVPQANPHRAARSRVACFRPRGVGGLQEDGGLKCVRRQRLSQWRREIVCGVSTAARSWQIGGENQWETTMLTVSRKQPVASRELLARVALAEMALLPERDAGPDAPSISWVGRALPEMIEAELYSRRYRKYHSREAISDDRGLVRACRTQAHTCTHVYSVRTEAGVVCIWVDDPTNSLAGPAEAISWLSTQLRAGSYDCRLDAKLAADALAVIWLSEFSEKLRN